uniref:tyrosine-type recombinase/integrase n=1 Tax=Dysgonomonas sp. TaxID=1891233 RepID=UPI0039E600C6
MIKSDENQLNCYLKEITNICGINKRITSHCARHTFGTLCLTEGMSIESVSKLLGHTKIRTTQIYAQITDQKLSNEMDKLAKKLNTT